MTEDGSAEFVHKLMNILRKVDTVICQLTDRFNVQKIKAKDIRHLCAKVGLKIFTHTMCCFVNSKLPLTNL
jgi:hypothetical protein